MLSDVELRVLSLLKCPVSFDDLVRLSGFDSSSIERALLWLSSKRLIKVKSVVKELVSLGLNGERYVVHGLPEKRLVGFVLDGVDSIQDLRLLFNDVNDFNIALGVLKEKGFVIVDGSVVKVPLKCVKWYGLVTSEEELLSLVKRDGCVDYSLLSKRLRNAVDVLSARKSILITELKTFRTVNITTKGTNALIKH